MGMTFGPSYASLFMGFLELNICSSYTGPVPEFYRRYIDEGLSKTSLTEDELIKFIELTNNFNPAIRFTQTISRTRVNFLDIEINITQNTLSTSCHYKDNDSHSYLLFSSSHPPSSKDSIPYSQLLRIRSLCQDDNDFTEKAIEMRVENLKREQAFKKKTKSGNDERPKLILIYHSHNVKAKNIFLKNLNILLADEHTRDVFSSPPLVVFRRDQNLQDISTHLTPQHLK
ncbi:hypothetical protein BgiBS90_008212 [Biomphalaria glabrata]|nr:hypothetical protein BgiBS90_008212 [Biomphalaria glabrata]